ncbi:hydroxylysine kinase-like isoform X1 [Petromyzon marinus]|uniref:hydroxylysine kinase-like isoform X1 n=1 Tax=Petromyzon marinus TaxID=7757 RepID=UPI003F72FF05
MSSNGQDAANGVQETPPPLLASENGLTKPDLSAHDASALLHRVYGLRVTHHAGVTPLDSYEDQNFCVLPDGADGGGGGGGGGYVLKVFSSGEGKSREFVLLQSEVMAFLRKRGFPVPEQVPTRRGEVVSMEIVVHGAVGRTHVVWLLTLLEGQFLSAIPRDGALCFQVGRLAAGLDKALLEFRSPLMSCLERRGGAAGGCGGEWDLCALPSLEARVSLLPGERARSIVREVIAEFRQNFLARRHEFRSGLIHGDFNDNNILAVPARSPLPGGASPWRVSGLLDFGDMTLGYLVFELAIAIAYAMIDAPDPVDVGGHVMAGYESMLPLSDEEKAVVFLVVLARLSQSALNAWHNVALHPQNERYLMVSAPKALALLCHLWDLGPRVVHDSWARTAQRLRKRSVANPSTESES